MKKINMEWNNKIKEQLQDFEQRPPKTSWESIAQKINADQAKVVPSAPNMRKQVPG
jgi:hypothetical protein